MTVEQPPARVVELAEACVQFVKNALNIELDSTTDTLPILDHYARDLASKPKAEVTGLLAPACGAYFGEVLRRTLPGVRWFAPADDYAVWRIEFDSCFLHFNPIGIAVEVLTRAEAEGWSAHLQMLDEDQAAAAESLERVGSVRSDDYYRFAVRAEAIEQVSTLLVARANRRGPYRRFGPEVYQAAAGMRIDSELLN
jgi:hypothetical protein